MAQSRLSASRSMGDQAVSEYELLDTLFDRLFPICRSIVGPGFRESLEIIRNHVPLEICAVPTGTSVFDWTVPKEWHIQGGSLTGPDGRVYADFRTNNLAVANRSIPVRKRLSLAQLRPYLYSIQNLPDAIPYVTMYYHESWGFCMPHRVLEALPEGQYEAVIDSELKDGLLHYGHQLLSGETDREVLLSSYLCHPSMANNELSGPLVLMLLARRIAQWKRRRLSYRFLLSPETIGSLVYLSQHGRQLQQTMLAGLVLTCLGGPVSSLSYKTTRRETSLLDETVLYMRAMGELDVRIRPFTPMEGSDERQYCSPGFNLPVGQMARTVYNEYEGYHNSLDTKAFMGIEPLIRSADAIEQLLRTLEYAGIFSNQSPYGEPQLSRRGLFPTVNSTRTREMSSDGHSDGRVFLNYLRMILNYSDGTRPMLDIAKRCQCRIQDLVPAIDRLESEGLLVFRGSSTT